MLGICLRIDHFQYSETMCWGEMTAMEAVDKDEEVTCVNQFQMSRTYFWSYLQSLCYNNGKQNVIDTMQFEAVAEKCWLSRKREIVLFQHRK